MLILTKDDLARLLQMADVIEAVEQGFHSLSQDKAFAPERLSMAIPASGGVLLEMPAYATDAAQRTVSGSKIVSVMPRNPQRGLALVQAVYLLLDGESGVPLALMEGKAITAIRTAATSAVATKYLTGKESRRLVIFGAGIQARFHIEAMQQVADLESISITSRTKEKACLLAEEMSALYHLDCKVLPPEEAVSQANLICTCTDSASPIISGKLLQAGCHINAVGAFTPTTREVDTETVRRASVFIDAESAAGRGAGDVLIPLAEGVIAASHIKGTLADLVSGNVQGRTSAAEITLFKSCGHAVEDLMTAQLAYTKALAAGIGAQVDF